MMMRGSIFLIFLVTLFVSACDMGTNGGNSTPTGEIKEPQVVVNAPSFNADTAYHYIERQVSFGPRVPNTAAHDTAAEWITGTLEQFADNVIVQRTTVQAYDGTMLNIQNIIGSFNPQVKKRILLCAHWDTRPIADWDKDPERRDEPILGANDGGSGVGVLLEIARQMKEEGIDIGVDIIFFDAEDYGQPRNSGGRPKDDTWCLGSQYWARNPHVPGYDAYYGILLDMVGAENSTFSLEQISMTYASFVMKKVWSTAHELGYSRYFINQRTGPITDDHYYINTIANIPCIDIINRDLTTQTGFGPYWHTHDDNMDIISKDVLKAVGQTVLQVVYEEAAGA